MLILSLCLQPVRPVILKPSQDLLAAAPVQPIATQESQAPPTARVTLVSIEPTQTRRTVPAHVSPSAFHLFFFIIVISDNTETSCPTFPIMQLESVFH